MIAVRYIVQRDIVQEKLVVRIHMNYDQLNLCEDFI